VRICFEWSREELRQSAPKPKKLSAKKKKKKKVVTNLFSLKLLDAHDHQRFAFLSHIAFDLLLLEFERRIATRQQTERRDRR
jgi:hypothetical protein